MGIESLILAILGTVWVAFNAIITALREINEKRDVIIVGFFQNNKLRWKHRKRLYENDWKPLYKVFLFMTASFGVIFFLLPLLAKGTTSIQSKVLWAICILISLIAFFAFGSFLKLGKSDKEIITEALNRAEKEEKEEG